MNFLYECISSFFSKINFTGILIFLAMSLVCILWMLDDRKEKKRKIKAELKKKNN